MKLYNRDVSPFACCTRIAVYAKRLAVEILEPPGGLPTDVGGRTSDAFDAINPLGLVPALELDDGRVLIESVVILAYLDAVQPTPGLTPSGPWAAARAGMISRLAELYLFPHVLLRFRQLRGTAKDPVAIAAAPAGIAQALGMIEGWLDDGAYAVGGRLSVADCMLAPMLNLLARLSPKLGVADPLAPFPRLAAYWQALAADPAVERAVGEQTAMLPRRMGGEGDDALYFADARAARRT